MAGVPTVCSCGAMGEWNHTVREYILESSLCQRAKLFTAAVLRLDEFRP
jgi:glutamate carboxypeptidase